MISLGIPDEVYSFVKKHGWKHKEVYLLGIQAKQDNPQLLNRIAITERGNEKLQRKLTELGEQIAKLKGEEEND